MRRRWHHPLLLGVALAIMPGFLSVGYAQLGGGIGGGMGGGIGSVPGTAYGGATDPSQLQITEGFRVIPSIAVSEMYDTNIFALPKSAGLQRDDFVTTVAPQVRGLYAGSLVSVNAALGATSAYFVNHRDFSYVGANAGLSLNLSKLVDQWWKGMQFTVSDSYMYTPQPPAFLRGDLEGEGGSPLLRGLQVGFVNSQSNNASTSLSAPLTQVVSVTGSYANGFLKFGSSDVQQVGALINTTYQNYMAGLTIKASPQDTMSLNFISSEYDSGSLGAFTTRGGTVGWAHLFSPTISVKANAGVTILQGEFQNTPIPSTIAPTGNAAFLWKDRDTSMTLSYSLAVAPTYQFESQALLSHTVSLAVTQLTPVQGLLGVFSLNYGLGDQIGSSSRFPISYTSYAATGGLMYKITPKTFLGLNYSYSNYDSNFGGTRYAFDKHLVQINLAVAIY